MRIGWLTNLMLLVCVSAGCSRSQKSGASISAQDVAKAMPEFTLTLPPGSTNVFLDCRSSPFASVYYKVTVPRLSVSNFLYSSGIKGEFFTVPAGTFASKSVPLPGGLDARNAMAWVSDVNHAAAWDLGKRNVPLRMTLIETFATSSPNERVFLTVFVDDSDSSEAPIYLQYLRVPKKFRR
jgi:hypothetical protein